MTKISVTRQALLGTSRGTRDNTTTKSFPDSAVKNGKLFYMDKKTFGTTSGTLKTGYCIHMERGGKITARFIINEILQ